MFQKHDTMAKSMTYIDWDYSYFPVAIMPCKD